MSSFSSFLFLFLFTFLFNSIYGFNECPLERDSNCIDIDGQHVCDFNGYQTACDQPLTQDCRQFCIREPHIFHHCPVEDNNCFNIDGQRVCDSNGYESACHHPPFLTKDCNQFCVSVSIGVSATQHFNECPLERDSNCIDIEGDLFCEDGYEPGCDYPLREHCNQPCVAVIIGVSAAQHFNQCPLELDPNCIDIEGYALCDSGYQSGCHNRLTEDCNRFCISQQQRQPISISGRSKFTLNQCHFKINDLTFINSKYYDNGKKFYSLLEHKKAYKTWEKCEKSCEEYVNDGCSAWLFIEKGNNCYWYKNGYKYFTHSSYSVGAGSKGYKGNLLKDYGIRFDNIILPLANNGIFHIKNGWKDCSKLCNKNNNCNAWTMIAKPDNYMCYLYRIDDIKNVKIIRDSSARDYVTGFKSCL